MKIRVRKTYIPAKKAIYVHILEPLWQLPASRTQETNRYSVFIKQASESIVGWWSGTFRWLADCNAKHVPQEK